MGYHFSKNLTINGTVNLLAQMVANGYNGPAVILGECNILNISASVLAYLHLTDSNVYPPGTTQVETVVVVGTITTAGNSIWTVIAANDPDLVSPGRAINVQLSLGLTAAQIAQAALIVLAADPYVQRFFKPVTISGANLVFEAKSPAADDATMNIAYADDTSVGLTDDATSTDTRAGALATTSGYPLQFGTGAPSASYTLPKGTDLSGVWIYTPSSLAIQVAAIG
jgi:hypothetical protein